MSPTSYQLLYPAICSAFGRQRGAMAAHFPKCLYRIAQYAGIVKKKVSTICNFFCDVDCWTPFDGKGSAFGTACGWRASAPKCGGKECQRASARRLRWKNLQRYAILKAEMSMAAQRPSRLPRRCGTEVPRRTGSARKRGTISGFCNEILISPSN